ncbi:MAG TPA: hypothetical protein PLI39_02690 [Petrotogaceae bacterium]|jgi:hypothetical protein|nr:hypothetical protein [Petrotogaceae bacterium]HPA92801.1 hypothetical protein [Petrotogaceae bacterium]HPO27349.1 hypothetical protein [Petrotogaceae bacterium]HPX16996.1 hypothetical protein [Petrotogaceae bacterium]HQO11451.1 hypothetical protein [Petrotogaceae bacterium]
MKKLVFLLLILTFYSITPYAKKTQLYDDYSILSQKSTSIQFSRSDYDILVSNPNIDLDILKGDKTSSETSDATETISRLIMSGFILLISGVMTIIYIITVLLCYVCHG